MEAAVVDIFYSISSFPTSYSSHHLVLFILKHSNTSFFNVNILILFKTHITRINIFLNFFINAVLYPCDEFSSYIA